MLFSVPQPAHGPWCHIFMIQCAEFPLFNQYSSWSRAFVSPTFWPDKGLSTNFVHPRRPAFSTNHSCVSTTSSQACNSKKDPYSKEWNFTGKCNCPPTEAAYKGIHRCCVCEADNAMPQCAKHRFSIRSNFTGALKSGDKNWLGNTLALVNAVRAVHAPNFSGARLPIQTNFNLAEFDFYLKHYQDRIIVKFLCYGWLINYVGSLPSSTFSNDPSVAKNSVFLRSYVHKELVHRSICGPFTSNPFDTDCVISPLLCIPSVTSTNSVVHGLSFPEGFSVNNGITKDSYLNEKFRLRLPGIDRLVEFANKEGSDCHVFKKDLSCTYCQIPVDPGNYHLLGFQVVGNFYFRSAFPFGLRSATLACQRTTQSVA